MSKKNLEKLTLENIIAKKIEREKNEIKFKEIEIPSLKGIILFNKPSEEAIIDAINTLNGNHEDVKIIDETFTELIYCSCPLFKELYKNKSIENIKIPTDIVKEFLTFTERIKIGNELVSMTGFNIETIGAEIKK